MPNRIAWFLMMLVGAPACAPAQWLNQPTPGTPRTRDGKPNLSAPAPRASNGKPDLSGIWQAEASPIPELISVLPGGVNGLGEDTPSKYFINILADYKPEEAPLQPSEAALFRKRTQAQFPPSRCLPVGVSQLDAYPEPHKLIQTPGVIVMLYETNTTFRQIFTDGRKMPNDPQPAWLGYSVGKWEGDWLVVDTTGFNDRSWLDTIGHTHSQDLHVMERFHRRDFGHMDVEVTIDDPKTYTKPFSIKFSQRLLPDTDLIEQYCAEDEKDEAHLFAK